MASSFQRNAVVLARYPQFGFWPGLVSTICRLPQCNKLQSNREQLAEFDCSKLFVFILQIVATDGSKFTVQFFDHGQLEEEKVFLTEADIKPFPEKDPKNLKQRRKNAFKTAR